MRNKIELSKLRALRLSVPRLPQARGNFSLWMESRAKYIFTFGVEISNKINLLQKPILCLLAVLSVEKHRILLGYIMKRCPEHKTENPTA